LSFLRHINETSYKLPAPWCKRSRRWWASSRGTPWAGTTGGSDPILRS
jgi:hypothetical protein